MKLLKKILKIFTKLFNKKNLIKFMSTHVFFIRNKIEA